MAARHVGGDPVSGVRKVRAPQRRVAGNARPSRDEDQCHSDDAAAGASRRRSETGKLHPEQGQIGGRNRGQPRGEVRCPALGSAARAVEQSAAPDGWPSATASAAATELGLQTASLTQSPLSCVHNAPGEDLPGALTTVLMGRAAPVPLVNGPVR